jgi:DNA polymerase eta
VKGDEAKALSSNARESGAPESGQERPEKRRRLEPMTGIQKFFGKTESTEEHDDEFGAQYLPGNSPSAEGGNADSDEFERAAATLPHDNENEATKLQHQNTLPTGTSALHQQQITDYICNRCNQALESVDDLDSHHDWHFAKDLHDEENGKHSRPPKVAPSKANKKPQANTSKKKSAREKPEKGQSKLAFG